MSRIGRGGEWRSGRRASPLQRLFLLIIALTLPCYCIGGLLLASDSLSERSRQLDVTVEPWVVGVGVVLLLLLVTEPLHGILSILLGLGLQVVEIVFELVSDPLGCGLLLLLLAGAAVAAFLYFGLPTL